MNEHVTKESDPSKERWQRRGAAVGCGLLIAIIIGLLILKVVTGARESASPTFTSAITGTNVETWTSDQYEENRMRVSWASRCVSTSSLGGHECTATSWPDVYPAHEHNGYAWYPLGQDDGLEWLHVSWNVPVRARAVVVVETFNPGALVAVDDLVDGSRPTLTEGERVRLWSGTTDGATESRVLLFRLAEPRYISDIRLVLDTERVEGFNELDSVGLLPE